MTRRSVLSATAAALQVQAQTRTPANRPNVLLFLTDQESDIVQREVLNLPNRERLERRGVRFTRNWCTTPQCSPARSSILTGRYPHSTGVMGNVGAAGGEPLAAGEPTLGTLFQNAGYRTGYFGKWHLTRGSRRGWDAHGFEATASSGAGDADIASSAASRLESIRDEPWLCVVSLIQPHDIYEYPLRARNAALAGDEMPIRPGVRAPETTAADLDSRPLPQRLFNENDQGQVTTDYGPEDWKRYRSFYYDLIEDADRNLGKLLAVAADSDAIVVYTSDHGDGLGSHGLAFKGPFLYEELMRVPMVVSWPGHVAEGTSVEALTSQTDIAPTLCDLAGLAPPELLHGRSLRPLLEGEPEWERDAVFGQYYSKQRWVNPARAVRTDRWKLVEYLRGGRELYDLMMDPRESENLAGNPDHQDTERALLERLERRAGETADAVWFERRKRDGRPG